jgi:hypothetical protein
VLNIILFLQSNFLRWKCTAIFLPWNPTYSYLYLLLTLQRIYIYFKWNLFQIKIIYKVSTNSSLFYYYTCLIVSLKDECVLWTVGATINKVVFRIQSCDQTKTVVCVTCMCARVCVSVCVCVCVNSLSTVDFATKFWPQHHSSLLHPTNL